jgi:hypothetical protein
VKQRRSSHGDASASAKAGEGGAAPSEIERLVERHTRLGWWALALFIALGLLLEGFHGLKSRFYMDVAQSSRRLMWTLAHAHGTLLALVNLALASTLPRLRAPRAARLATASASLVVATGLLPAGFFLGGVRVHGGDPGLAVLLVPLGGAALLAAAVLIALESRRR